MRKVIFVCVHNSGRSQMAEAFARKLGDGKIAAESAGTEPGGGLNPQAEEAMKEIGYDLAGHYPKVLSPEMIQDADRIITMGCDVDSAACPANYYVTEDWGLDDPNGQPIEKVREIRDQIRKRVENLVAEMTKDGG